MAAEHLPGRFAFHGLLRAYAAEAADRADTETDRRAAAHRVLDHYLHTAMTATARFSPHRPPLRLDGPQPGVVPAGFPAKEQAVAWFDAEAPVLLALIDYASAHGFDAHAWQLPWALGPFFNLRGRGGPGGLPAARAGGRARLGDVAALAHTLLPARQRTGAPGRVSTRPITTCGRRWTCSANWATWPTKEWC